MKQIISLLLAMSLVLSLFSGVALNVPVRAWNDTATSDQATPDEATPDEATPDEATPDEATPDEATPDEATPDEATPDEATPDEATPDEVGTESFGNYIYAILSDGTCAIKKYQGAVEELTIPAEMNGYTVTIIGDKAFEGCDGFTAVTIPESVTYIGDEAFASCSGLAGVVIPDSVRHIGANAFANDNDVALYAEAGSKAVEKYAASYGNSVYYLENNVISGTIGELSWTIDPSTGVLALTGGKEVPALNEQTSPWYPHRLVITSLELSDTITTIGDRAFRSLYMLENVNIPEGVTAIGASAFTYCISLAEVDLPDSITVIGTSAFAYCTGLTNIDLPERLTKIGSNAFAYCYDLTTLTIPEGVTEIGNAAFSYCDVLTEINIPARVSKIGPETFGGCASLEKVVVYSKNCEFDANCGLNGQQTIYGYKDSTAEALAGELGAEFVVMEEKIILPGDVNGDGRLNVADVSMAYAYTKGIEIPDVEKILACCDINGDGRVNVADVSKMYAHTKGINPIF